MNLLENTDLAARMGGFKACTINFYNSKGQALGQITDTISSADLNWKLNGL